MPERFPSHNFPRKTLKFYISRVYRFTKHCVTNLVGALWIIHRRDFEGLCYYRLPLVHRPVHICKPAARKWL